jgi:hypothetical protein
VILILILVINFWGYHVRQRQRLCLRLQMISLPGLAQCKISKGWKKSKAKKTAPGKHLKKGVYLGVAGQT